MSNEIISLADRVPFLKTFITSCESSAVADPLALAPPLVLEFTAPLAVGTLEPIAFEFVAVPVPVAVAVPAVAVAVPLARD